jgi:hypothetical protein
LDAFSQVTRDLTSCLYDAPKGNIDEKAEVAYYDPIARKAVTIKPSQGCAEPTGWTSEGGKVRFCPAACDKLVTTLRDRSDLALALGNSAQAVPIFASVNCR